jgi:hypothetical protein
LEPILYATGLGSTQGNNQGHICSRHGGNRLSLPSSRAEDEDASRKYDFKWLLHAMTVETNKLGQPVLLLDGPRGMDALTQFLSARRYLYRQVYNHPTIRGAQILLKAIFARLQDLGPNAGSLSAILDNF